MANLSSNGESLLLTTLLTSRFISLHTAAPSDAGSNEVSTSGTAYARQAGGTFTQASNNPMTASNAAQIDFPIATASWGTVTHFGIWSASSGGTFYGAWALTTSKAIALDDIARFIIGALVASLD